MKTVLSMGGGVNSTALFLMWGDPLDYVLFADTGSEKPETYKYLEEYIVPECLRRDIPFVTIRRTGVSRYTLWPLHEYYEKKLAVPFRKQRETTVMWKIRPIDHFLKKFAKPCQVLIAIDYGEVERMRDPAHDWITNRYPLVDWKIKRSVCEDIIRRYGWPVPPKSGCWCCPFNTLRSWQSLLLENPDLYKRAETLEQNAIAKRGPKARFHDSGTLLELRERRFHSKDLFDYLTKEAPEQCLTECFT